MNVLAGLYRPDEGRIRVGGQDVEFRSPRDAIAAGIGMVHQHFTLVPSQTVAENVLLGPRYAEVPARPQEDREGGRPAGQRRGAAGRPRRLRLAAVGRRAAARRDHQAAVPRGARPDPRRADGGPRATGDRRAVHDAALDGRRRPERGLHQPQARRGPVHRRPDHGHARRRGDRGRHRPVDGDARRPCPAHGRPARAGTAASAPRSSPAAWSCTSTTSMPRATAGCPRCEAASLEVHAGEIVGVAAVAGNGQSELAQVITGLRTCTGRVTIDGRDVGDATVARGDRRRRRPRPRGPGRRRQRAEPVARRQPHPAARSAIHRSRADRSSTTGRPAPRPMGCGRPTPSRHRPSMRRCASCRAATSSGSSSPARSTRRRRC